ncbi:phage tail assembly chaperone [Porticoccaceae bacterium]|jgi:hypothetical protein|nr:phage tail assembly chaperone [Porticoccaceae bacterium]
MSDVDYTKLWHDAIAKRNRKLLASDWTQLADCPLSESKKQEWAIYRQALRDIPARIADDEKPTTNPLTLVPGIFPLKPS